MPAELQAEFGEGYTYSSLTRMIRFAEAQPNEAIVSTLSTQLSWSHFMEILPVKDPLARDLHINSFHLDCLVKSATNGRRNGKVAILLAGC